jgi:serine/threonine-protein kinase
MGLLMAHCDKPVPPMHERNPDVVVPEALEALVRQMLEKNPADRPASADAVIRALKGIERDLTGDSVPTNRSVRRGDILDELLPEMASHGAADQEARRGATSADPPLTPLLALVVVGVVLGTAWALSRSKTDAPLAPASSSPSATPSVAPTTFQLVVDSQPTGAELFEGDRPLGKTPAKLPIERASVKNEARKFTLRLAGYAPFAFYQHDSATDVKVSAALVAVPPVSPSASASASVAETKPTPFPARPKASTVAPIPTPTPSDPDLQIKKKR